jgi:E3 ubiquitin-protein ligase listerin
LKDRQFSSAIAAFTSSYFSPVLIASELIHVKPSSNTGVTTPADDALNDETFNVKVALAVNEVTATFTVDDQQMEIGIKLPIGYPLKPVDVRPIRRIGVPEKVWRKWLFVVQQVVTSHVRVSCLIFYLLIIMHHDLRTDGLSMGLHCLKKLLVSILKARSNVPSATREVYLTLFVASPNGSTLRHFRIIHVVDRSLPSKPCRTCKTRFHADCLYKVCVSYELFNRLICSGFCQWFNTSHSSSCPLCRSDIMGHPLNRLNTAS